MLLAIAVGATALASGAPPDTVASIDFDPTHQPVMEATLKGLVTVVEGEPLDPDAVSETIHNLYRTGRYAFIEARQEPVDDGVRVVFTTRSNYFVGEVQVVGIRENPSENQLINATGLRLGEIFTDEKLAVAQQSLETSLRTEGFYLSAVLPSTEVDEFAQQVAIRFDIELGPRAAIGSLFVTGNSEIDEAQLRQITKWGEGKDFRQDRIDRGLARLRRYLRERDYWQAEIRTYWPDYENGPNRLNGVIDINTGPRMIVRVEGENFSQGRLRKYLPIFEEGVIDEDLLAEGRRNLTDYLQTRGYFSAQVEYTRERERDDEVIIVYRIERGPRHQLVEVEISGNNFFDTGTIRERMLIHVKTFQMRRGRFSRSLLQRDIEAIEELYRSNGFRNIVVDDRVQDDYQGKPGNIAVFIDINEGRPTLVSELIVNGIESIPAQPLLAKLASVQGQPFSDVSVATDRDLILAEYFDAGYQDARFRWVPAPTDDPNQIRVEYEIEEGQPVIVRRPIVSGLNHTKEWIVFPAIEVTPGEPLSQSDLFDSQRRLYDLGIFSKVEVGLQNPQGEEQNRTVLVQLEEARRWTLGFGAGAEIAQIGGDAGPDTPLGKAAFSPRGTIEVTRLNVRGIAHTMSIRTRFSQLQQRALFTYEAPRWLGSDRWHMTISSLFDSARNVRTFQGSRLEGAFQLRQRPSRDLTLLYRYTYRRNTIDPDSLQIDPNLIPLASRPVRVSLLSATAIRDRRDDPTDATRGSYNTLDLSLASGYWGSEPDFMRVLAQNATYHRFTPRVVFARTFQLGVMLPSGGFPNESEIGLDFASNPDPRIPISERFFAGGANSHRGFPINQAGPRDPTTGFAIGGGALMVNSLELRFPLIGADIGGVLFHDAGNLYSKPGRISFKSSQREFIENGRTAGFDFDYMEHAVGVGLRYRTPIGPVRLDLAYSLNPPRFVTTTNVQRISHLQFHFSLGQTF